MPTLAGFRADAVRKPWSWPLPTDGRRHVRSRIDLAELPVLYQTRRTGRPYTPGVGRDRRTFRPGGQARSHAESELAWLRTRNGAEITGVRAGRVSPRPDGAAHRLMLFAWRRFTEAEGEHGDPMRHVAVREGNLGPPVTGMFETPANHEVDSGHGDSRDGPQWARCPSGSPRGTAVGTHSPIMACWVVAGPRANVSAPGRANRVTFGARLSASRFHVAGIDSTEGTQAWRSGRWPQGLS